jgi:hypothetical protein
LVDLAQETRNMKYYILPTTIVNDWLIRDYEDWVNTPGKNGRPHNPENKKRQITQKKYEEEYGLLEYLDDLERLWI